MPDPNAALDVLVAQLSAADPMDLPGILAPASHLVARNFYALRDALAAHSQVVPSASLMVAELWLKAYNLTYDAFWPEDDAWFELSPFGTLLLAETALTMAGLRPMGEVVKPAAAPTDDDGRQLLAAVEERLTEDQSELQDAILLATLLARSMPHAPPGVLPDLGQLLLRLTMSLLDHLVHTPAWSAFTDWLFGQAEPGFPDGSADQAGCRMNWGDALLDRFRALGDLRDLETALARYAQAEPGFPAGSADQASCRMNWGIALATRFRALDQLPDLEAALARFAQAEPAFSAGSASQANCRMNWGIALRTQFEALGELPDLEGALARFAQAEPGLPDRSPNQANCRMNWGNALLTRFAALGELPDLEGALACYAQAEPGFPDGSARQATCRMNWGNALLRRFEARSQLQDMEGALAQYAQAEPGFPDGSADQANCRMNWGNALLSRFGALGELPDLEAALARYAQAEPVFPDGSADQASCRMNWASALVARFLALGAGEDLELALAKYAQAEPVFLQRPPDVAMLQRRWGRALLLRYGLRHELPDLEQALRLFSAALLYYQPHQPRGSAAVECLTGLVRCLWLLAEHQGRSSAQGELGALERALLLQQPAADQVAALHATLEAVTQDPALQYDRLVLRLLQQALVTLYESHLLGSDPETQPVLEARGAQAYRDLVRLLLEESAAQSGDAAGAGADAAACEAWQMAERSKARRMVQLLMASANQPARSADPARLALLQQLAALRRQPLDAPDHPAKPDDRPWEQRSSVTASPTEGAAERQALWALQQRDPALAALHQIVSPDLATVQASLRAVPDGAVLLELFPLDDRLLVFCLDGARLRVVPVAGITLEDLAQWTERLRSAGRDDHARYDAALQWLGAQLLPALEPLLPAAHTGDHASHLLLVPTGDLHHWPLWALPFPDSHDRLLDRYACSVLPSADTLVWLDRQTAEPGGYRGFAPPSDLPFAEPQVRFEAGHYRNGASFTGAAATFETLVQQTGGIFAFSTHCRVRGDRPELSTVDLVDIAGRRTPVTVLEFLVGLDGLHLQAAFLWACGTHEGGALAGDHWAGVTRAFLRAAKTLVATLWPIDNPTTMLLAVPFASGLSAGLTVPQALRQAQRALRDATAATLHQWAEQVALAQPDPAAFRALWQGWCVRQGLPLDPALAAYFQPFPNLLRLWAPYLAIGAPSALAENSLGSSHPFGDLER